MHRYKKYILGFTAAAALLFVSAACEPWPVLPNAAPSSQASYTVKYGAINPDVTQKNIKTTICKVGWTKTVRPPESYTYKIKRQMMKDQHWKGKAILDHYIPLQGGGAPRDPKNFILQTPKDSYIKDHVEDKMHDDICSGHLTLKKAQQIMGAGWQFYGIKSR
jgi:hypothetical protein